MQNLDVLTALGSLAQETRLDIFRSLVGIVAAGASAGQIAEHFGLPLQTLSFHLKTLQHAGLVQRIRQSRLLIYSADLTTINAVLGYLTENCCAGHPEDCGIPVTRQA